MKKLLLLLSGVLCGFAAQAQTDSIATDTTATCLKEVEVRGRTQRLIKYGVEYTPDKRVKRQAADASRLLEAMQIPQLVFNPVSHGIRFLAKMSVFSLTMSLPPTMI